MDKGNWCVVSCVHVNRVYNETLLWFLHLDFNIERALAPEVSLYIDHSRYKAQLIHPHKTLDILLLLLPIFVFSKFLLKIFMCLNFVNQGIYI